MPKIPDKDLEMLREAKEKTLIDEKY